ncbi:MAG: PASTA domain-containing protein [Gemmatimonadaceae bacterium]
MQRRAVLRRAFPYLVIGIGGFALAYVLIFAFVLPSNILPPPVQPYVPDSSNILRPIDTATTVPSVQSGATAATIPMADPTPAPLPVQVPDLTGMALPDARGILNSLRLHTIVERDTSSLQPPNTVIRQLPLPQTDVQQSGTVTVTVSYFPRDTTDAATQDTIPVQRGSTLPPIRSAEPDTARHPGS